MASGLLTTGQLRARIDPDEPRTPASVALMQAIMQLEAAERVLRPSEERDALERDHQEWLYKLFPSIFVRKRDNLPIPFAPAHDDYWRHVWQWQVGVRPRSMVMILARGGGKSTNGELTPIATGARGVRRYWLYVSATQDLADKHVGSIMNLLETKRLQEVYPLMAERRLNKYGSSRGWRRNRLSTAQGLTVDAIGLDVATRGIKMDTDRPDGIIFDDVDDRRDDIRAVEKKIETITYTILPAGSDDCAVVFTQNVIHHNSVAARLAGIAKETADFMQDRFVIGPVPALDDFAWHTDYITDEKGRERPRYVIVSGTPTWEGQDLETCQKLLDTIAIKAFRAEAQHEDIQQEGGLFDKVELQYIDRENVPWHEIRRVSVWVDPAISSTDKSDSHGLQCDALAEDNTIYRLYSWEGISEPVDSIKRALLVALAFGSDSVGIETDQGGDTWQSVYREAWTGLADDPEKTDWLVSDLRLHDAFPQGAAHELREGGRKRPRFESEKAGSIGSKSHRANLMLADYENGNVVHVKGTHAVLDRALRRYLKQKPYDLVDAAFWSWYDLRGGRKGDHPVGALAQAVARKPSWSNGRVITTTRQGDSAPTGPRRATINGRARPVLVPTLKRNRRAVR